MGKRLINLDPNELSVVDAGANRRGPLILRAQTTGGGSMKPKVKRNDEEVETERADASTIETLKAMLEGLDPESAEAMALAAAIAELEAAPAPDPAPDPVAMARAAGESERIIRAVKAGASPELVAIMRETEREVAIEREARLLRAAVDRAGADFPLLGKPADVGYLLRGAEAQGTEYATALETVFRAANARIELSGEIGDGGEDIDDDEGGARSVFNRRVDEEIKRGASSRDDAITRATRHFSRHNPALLDEVQYGPQE